MRELDYVIMVTGTPGTGKTVVSRKLENLLECKHINSSEYLKRLNLIRKDPTGRYTEIVDVENFRNAVDQLVSLTRCTILETLYPSLWLENGLEEYVPIIILLRTHPLELYKRLKSSREWPEEKIIENSLAEAFNEIAEELLDYSHSVIELDTTNKPTERIVEELIESLEEWRTGIEIDWLNIDPSLTDYITTWTHRLNLDKYRLGDRGRL